MTKKELLNRLEDIQMQMNLVEQMLKDKSALSKRQVTLDGKQKEFINLEQDKARVGLETTYALAE
ncbi:hypothetical protein J14TS2_05710 [Bacillus sp. J14TS2]|uniref:hypothetical protein n=1 Tax=Bacillus sp. J14TS2 TaxID=2807188 RepID=UPI001B16F8F3|nr:hypothetical protein [Bacillus sp. J14TS2]GIN70096.1 hypothetical protein J14TS2_05710 [Bacillus sp. J14TS2]